MSDTKVTITRGDKNQDFLLFDATEAPITLYGFRNDMRRLPLEVTESANPFLSWQARMPAGARLRFKTDAPHIILNIDYIDYYSHFIADVYEYENGKYIYREPLNKDQCDETTVVLAPQYQEWEEDYIMRDLVVFLPYDLVVNKIQVGIPAGYKLEKATEYKYDLPILTYGSSIVHGAGALRSSSVYSNILSRIFDIDVINLGFAGNAHAELPLIEYIGDQKISIFIYDYDHNAQTVEDLKATHYIGYETFRKKQPNTPLIMASRVDYHRNPANADLRRAVILESYAKGLANGDRNLYFVDGKDIYDDYQSEYSYDGCHPNDAGYMKMAVAFANVIKELL